MNGPILMDYNKRADDIGAMFLRCADTLRIPMTKMINLSLKKRSSPTWKINSMTRIFESGNNVNNSNYRLISIVSVLPKLMDSILHRL